MLAPFWPQISWWIKHESPVKTAAPASVEKAVKTAADLPDESGDWLLIPALGMKEQIHGGGMEALRKGVWHIPKTSTPDKQSNTVLVGHRFTYSGQAVFYHLDKVKVNDPIVVKWQGRTYVYEVKNILVVPPTAVEVEAPTKEPRLTIYTCTPLLTAKYRLVIQADLKEVK
jgi:sortase A